MLWDFCCQNHINKFCLTKFVFIHAWWESTKWISWKEFAQTGPEKVCDKVIISKLE
jgi:hypothetical protein